MSYVATAVLKDRVAVITGGTGGIGLETAKAMAGEWAKRGVRVNSISPGYINTPMTPRDQIRRDWYELWMQFSPMERIGEPQEIAPAVVFLASDASSFFTGSNLVIDGGYTCW
jgi:NAD(P)-dependent dehydrogenase (short-subunit alcohol dehydrogenase family)